jgi:large subunit ribosomal protein L21
MYTICEISGKQYKLIPGTAVLVDLLDIAEDVKQVKVKALARSVEDKFEIGTPYLKDDVTLEVLGMARGEKIRVAKFHAKANFRRVNGHRSKLTRVMLKA